MLNLWSATTGRIQDGQIASVICKVAHAVLALGGSEGRSGGMEVRGRVREEVGRQGREEGATSGQIGTVRCRRDLRVSMRLRVFYSFCGFEAMAVAVSVVSMAMAMVISLQFAGRRSPARAPGRGARADGSVGGVVFVVSLVSGQGWERLDSDVGGGAVGACARRRADA